MGDAVEDAGLERTLSGGPCDTKDETQLALAKTLHNVPWCEQYERMISGML
jgi:hypothetical protein